MHHWPGSVYRSLMRGLRLGCDLGALTVGCSSLTLPPNLVRVALKMLVPTHDARFEIRNERDRAPITIRAALGICFAQLSNTAARNSPQNPASTKYALPSSAIARKAQVNAGKENCGRKRQ